MSEKSPLSGLTDMVSMISGLLPLVVIGIVGYLAYQVYQKGCFLGIGGACQPGTGVGGGGGAPPPGTTDPCSNVSGLPQLMCRLGAFTLGLGYPPSQTTGPQTTIDKCGVTWGTPVGTTPEMICAWQKSTYGKYVTKECQCLMGETIPAGPARPSQQEIVQTVGGVGALAVKGTGRPGTASESIMASIEQVTSGAARVTAVTKTGFTYSNVPEGKYRSVTASTPALGTAAGEAARAAAGQALRKSMGL